MPNKKFLLVLLAVVIFILGCAAKEKPSEKPVKEIVIGVTDKVTDLDPANAYDFYTWEVLNNIMGGLMRYKPGTTELEP